MWNYPNERQPTKNGKYQIQYIYPRVKKTQVPLINTQHAINYISQKIISSLTWYCCKTTFKVELNKGI